GDISAGGSTSAPLNQVVNSLTSSTTALSSSANPSTFGAPVMLTATVTPSSASGKVTFYQGTAVLGISALAGGTATLSTPLLPSGTGSLRAYYPGDSNTAGSSSATFAQSVNTVPGSSLNNWTRFSSGGNPVS